MAAMTHEAGGCMLPAVAGPTQPVLNKATGEVVQLPLGSRLHFQGGWGFVAYPGRLPGAGPIKKWLKNVFTKQCFMDPEKG
eukprot:3997203-Lingulodinium_polyedra.AAC.1